MKKKQYRIITSSKILYNKLNSLNYSRETTFDLTDSFALNKIISSINRNENILEKEIIGNKIKIKKLNPAIFNVYLNKNF